uniref:Uncharacterized protein n=1 Tax=Anguilla anguilla TaxID=7936 RepID=A0A0E9XPK4_ANGAN
MSIKSRALSIVGEGTPSTSPTSPSFRTFSCKRSSVSCLRTAGETFPTNMLRIFNSSSAMAQSEWKARVIEK